MAPRRRANCQICDKVESKYACPICEVLYCSIQCYKQHKSYSCGASMSADNGASTAQANTISTDSENSRIESEITDTQEIQDRQEGGNERSRSIPEPVYEASPSLLVGDASSSRVRQGELLDVIAETSHLGAGPSVEAGKVETQPQLSVENVPGKGTVESVAESERDASPEAPRPLRKLSSLKWPYVPDAPSYPDPLTRDDPKPLSLAQYEAITRSSAIRRALSSHSRLPSLVSSLDALRGPARERALERLLGVAPSQQSFSLAGLPASSSLHSHTYKSTSRGERFAREETNFGLEGGVDEEDMKALCELAEAVEAAVRPAGGAEGRFGADPLGLDWESMGA